jgi:hypothetical protein
MKVWFIPAEVTDIGREMPRGEQGIIQILESLLLERADDARVDLRDPVHVFDGEMLHEPQIPEIRTEGGLALPDAFVQKRHTLFPFLLRFFV